MQPMQPADGPQRHATSPTMGLSSNFHSSKPNDGCLSDAAFISGSYRINKGRCHIVFSRTSHQRGISVMHHSSLHIPLRGVSELILREVGGRITHGSESQAERGPVYRRELFEPDSQGYGYSEFSLVSSGAEWLLPSRTVDATFGSPLFSLRGGG